MTTRNVAQVMGFTRLSAIQRMVGSIAKGAEGRAYPRSCAIIARIHE
jgi:hypothetical protein